MKRLAILAILLAAVTVRAEDGWRFKWQAGKVLTYRVEQQTEATEINGDSKARTLTHLKLTKRWTVQAVDASGVATVQHSLAELRMELTTPGGETLVFDSAAPEKSDPKLREQMSRYVGVPLATLRVDARGQVIEVKESRFGPASRFEAEPPFALVLPAAVVKPGQDWHRDYKITQEPPAGAGEKYQAVQHCTCKDVAGGMVTVTLTTALATQPKSLADRIPLLQFQPEGTIVFDAEHGRLQEAKLTVSKELKGHAGEGTSYLFRSSYGERFAGER